MFWKTTFFYLKHITLIMASRISFYSKTTRLLWHIFWSNENDFRIQKSFGESNFQKELPQCLCPSNVSDLHSHLYLARPGQRSPALGSALSAASVPPVSGIASPTSSMFIWGKKSTHCFWRGMALTSSSWLPAVSCLLLIPGISLAILPSIVSKYSGSFAIGLLPDIKKWLERLQTDSSDRMMRRGRRISPHWPQSELDEDEAWWW